MFDPITTLSIDFTTLTPKKILVTGGMGFLGSNLINKITKLGYQSLAISRNTPNPNQQILEFNPDIVIHCAWDGGNNYNSINSLDQFNNVSQGIELIKILSKLPTPTRFIGVGSFAEYGTLSRPALETDVEKPINLYGLSKYTFKTYSQMLCNEYNIEWGWIRPCYVYGPGDVYTRLIPTIINKLLSNKKVKLDKCDKLIDYIYIDDFTNFTTSLITGNLNGVYNICSGHQYKLRNVINQIGEILNKSNNISFNKKSTRKLTSPIVCGNNFKIKQYSNVKLLTNLTLGLSNTIEYYKNI
jgi:nucleoside-diphosphate-sugar epimerase